MAAGQRPITNVVDITNYVMLLTGQPLHAFDFDRVAGGRLVVRSAPATARRSRRSTDERRSLDADVVVIDDADGPTSIAGIMGGARSEVGADTTRVLMEAATWNGPEHPPHLAAARPAQRGLGPVREAAPARVHAGGAGRRHGADARAVRRAARARAPLDVGGPGPAAGDDPAARAAR